MKVRFEIPPDDEGPPTIILVEYEAIECCCPQTLDDGTQVYAVLDLHGHSIWDFDINQMQYVADVIQEAETKMQWD